MIVIINIYFQVLLNPYQKSTCMFAYLLVYLCVIRVCVFVHKDLANCWILLILQINPIYNLNDSSFNIELLLISWIIRKVKKGQWKKKFILTYFLYPFYLYKLQNKANKYCMKINLLSIFLAICRWVEHLYMKGLQIYTPYYIKLEGGGDQGLRELWNVDFSRI